MAGVRQRIAAPAAQRRMLTHFGQIISGIALLAFGGAVGASAAERGPGVQLIADPIGAWAQALKRPDDAPLLTAAGASSALGLALLIAPALSTRRRRPPAHVAKAAATRAERLDVEVAVLRAAARLIERAPPGLPEGLVEEFNRRLTSLFSGVETEKRAAALLLDAGDEHGAAVRLEALARRQDEVFGRRSRLAGRTWRELAVLRIAESPAQGLEAYRRAGRRDPNDYWSQLFCARLARMAGDALTAHRAAQDAVRTAVCERTRVTALTLYGDVARTAGDLVEARGAYESALAISRQSAARAPRAVEWLRDLTTSYQRLGDVERAAGAFQQAIAYYRRSLPSAAALIEREPDNARWRLEYEVARRRVAELEAEAARAI